MQPEALHCAAGAAAGRPTRQTDGEVDTLDVDAAELIHDHLDNALEESVMRQIVPVRAVKSDGPYLDGGLIVVAHVVRRPGGQINAQNARI